MNYFRILSLLIIFSLSSCGFEDNLPCKSSECENVPEPLPNSDNEVKKNPHE